MGKRCLRKKNNAGIAIKIAKGWETLLICWQEPIEDSVSEGGWLQLVAKLATQCRGQTPVVQCLTQMHDVRGQWQPGVDWPVPDIIYRVELSGRVRPAQQPQRNIAKDAGGWPESDWQAGRQKPAHGKTAIDSTSLGFAAS